MHGTGSGPFVGRVLASNSQRLFSVFSVSSQRLLSDITLYKLFFISGHASTHKGCLYFLDRLLDAVLISSANHDGSYSPPAVLDHVSSAGV